MKNFLLEDEEIEDLQIDGLQIIQKKCGYFRFGTDSIELSKFIDVRKGNKILDIGTGSGVLSIIISKRAEDLKISAVEIQKEVSNMAMRSVQLNDIQHIINVLNMDIMEWKTTFEKSSFDVIVSNPPYKEINSGIINPNNEKAIARHEVCLKLTDLIQISRDLLKQYGVLYLVHKPERIVDLMCLMRENKIEPKEIKFVYPSYNKRPSMILVKGQKNGGKNLKILQSNFSIEGDL